MTAAAVELRSAAAVLCVSEFTAREAREVLRVRRTYVVPNGVDPAFLDARPAADHALAARGIRRPYVQVGAGATTRKNLPALAAAWAVTQRRWPDVQLVLTGPSHPRRDALFAGLPRVVRTGWLPAPEMPPLVAAAEAVVVPSTYEGFGLPALEAMAAGTTLVATDIPALREVVQDPAMLVDPDVDGLVDGLDVALGQGGAVRAAVRRGQERARDLTWEASARAHVEVWRRVVGEGPT